jgi:Na+/H+-dicarboxylate symporter
MAAVIGGVYRLIDIGNTAVNVLGDMVATRVVAASGGWTADRGTQARNDFQDRF